MSSVETNTHKQYRPRPLHIQECDRIYLSVSWAVLMTIDQALTPRAKTERRAWVGHHCITVNIFPTCFKAKISYCKKNFNLETRM